MPSLDGLVPASIGGWGISWESLLVFSMVSPSPNCFFSWWISRFSVDVLIILSPAVDQLKWAISIAITIVKLPEGKDRLVPILGFLK